MTKTAIVTGSSSGIGRACAVKLGNAGWNVVLTARRKDALEETAALIKDGNEKEKVLIEVGDITDEGFVQRLFSEAVKQFGRVDLLFNNAGSNAPQVPIEEMSLDKFKEVISTNLVAPWLCTREAVKTFKSQEPKGGRIINNGSLSAHVPRPHTTPYTCSKHAILGLTKSTALDGRPDNITATQLDIGNAQTDMASRLMAGALQADGSTKVEAVFDVDHVANAVLHIAELPNDVTVLEMNIMATAVPFVGRG